MSDPGANKQRPPRKNAQFVRADSYSYSSGLTLDLINSARTLLVGSATEGSERGFQDLENHASHCAPGAILNAVCAFELFLNALLVGNTGVCDTEMQKLLDLNAIQKVDHLTKLFNTKCNCRADLQLAVEVRNEITHHFPRPGRAASNLPAWLHVLQVRGLLITARGPDDYDLGQKLGSYKLGYWVARITAEAVSDIIGASRFWLAQFHRHDVNNFATMLAGVPEPPRWNG